MIRLEQSPEPGRSLEDWARTQRYRALAEVAGELGADTVFTAHHADDQAETVLLRLARGAGLQGASAMSVRSRTGGSRVRPLLSLPRRVLRIYAVSHGLSWVEDPSNQDTDRARNQVRQVVLPALEQAVPGAAANLARAAELAREGQAVLDELAQSDLRRVGPEAKGPDWGLSRERLAGLSVARQRLCLRAWLARAGQRPVSLAVLSEMQRQLIEAAGAAGEVKLAAVVARRYRDRVWLDSGRWPLGPWRTERLAWRGESNLPTIDGQLALTKYNSSEVNFNFPVEIELSLLMSSIRLRLRPGGPSRSLRHWQQQLGIPASLRPHLPAIRVGGRLVHVVGLGDHHEPAQPPLGWQVRWFPREPDDPRQRVCAMQYEPDTRV